MPIDLGWPDRPAVLVVDDEEDMVLVLAQGLRRAGFDVVTANSGAQALERLEERRFDVLLSDVHMPRMRGDELQRIARQRYPHLAALLLTAAHDVFLAVDCLKEGVADYITKPFDLRDLSLRVQRAVERERLVQENRAYQAELEERVREQADHIRLMFQNSLQALNCALEAKDYYTRNHSNRVTALTVLLADRLYPEDREFRRRVRLAAQFHDIGKIGVPEAILNKPGRLTPAEFDEIKKHPVIGEHILRPLFTDPEMLAIVRHHHEAWDGTGYPDRRVGKRIPLGARVIAVADSYDAMTSERPYRPGMPPERALAILRDGAGGQWDSDIIGAFVDLAADNEVERVLDEQDRVAESTAPPPQGPTALAA